jgi:hypothetical protein
MSVEEETGYLRNVTYVGSVGTQLTNLSRPIRAGWYVVRPAGHGRVHFRAGPFGTSEQAERFAGGVGAPPRRGLLDWLEDGPCVDEFHDRTPYVYQEPYTRWQYDRWNAEELIGTIAAAIASLARRASE